MRIVHASALALTAAVLCACGGGGGGGGGVEPLVPRPAQSNTNIANLTVDETFKGPAANANSVYNLVSGTTVSSNGAAATISVTYNAAAKSYTVSLPGRSQTFTPSDRDGASVPGEISFAKTAGATKDRLTLVTTPFSSNISNRYVGMGLWQTYESASGRQNDQFATFVYGITTPASGTPRSGQAAFDIDVLGLSTVPGYGPSVFQGRGLFNVDFMAGVFSTQTYLTETELLTGSSIVGGGIELIGAGLLTSGASSFTGNVTVGGRNARLSGTLAGQFYGPGAEEVGASFSATNPDGATATGSFTGQRGNSPAVNLTLANMVTPQLFYAQGTALFLDTYADQINYIWTYRAIGQLQDRTSGNLSYGPGLSNMAGGEFTTASIIAGGDPNFTTYQKRFGESDVRLELFKLGQSNSQLALTYSTLGRWQSRTTNGLSAQQQFHHFVYGLETPSQLLAARTGSARYEGVVYGAAGNRTTGEHYDVRGTSSFDVDFSRQKYSGALSINGRNNGTTIDFGSYGFAGNLSATTTASATDVTYGGANVGTIETRFFGPTGEEIGGDFNLTVPEALHPGSTVVGGATIARRK